MIEFLLLASAVALFGSDDQWFTGWVPEARQFYWAVTLLMLSAAVLIVSNIRRFQCFPSRRVKRIPLLSLYVGATLLTLWMRLRVIEQWPVSAQDSDMLPAIQQAIARFLEGRNPYGQYLPNPTIPWEVWLVYLPGLWISYIPAFLLDLDFRIWGLVWIVGLVAVHYLYSRDKQGLCVLAGVALLSLLLLVPKSFNFSRIGHTFPYWFTLACFSFFTLKRRYVEASICAAILAAMRILFVPLLALWLIFLWKRRRQLDFKKNLLVTLSIPVAIQAPFFLADPWAYYFGTVRWYEFSNRWVWDTPRIQETFGFTGMLHALGMVEAYRWVQPALFLPLLALASRVVRGESDLLVWLGFLLMMLSFLTPVPHYYIYFPPFILMMFGCLGRWSNERRE